MAKAKKIVKQKTVDLDFLRNELKQDIVEMEENYDYFLTGNPMFDAFVGSGGLPLYQLEYIWGTASIGKSTLAIQILASYLKQFASDKSVLLYLDTEESVTPPRLRALGISDKDIKLINVLNPESIERVKEIITKLRANYTDIDLFIIWDTISQTPAQEELDGYQKIGMQARALTSLFRTTKFYSSKLTMLVLNQFREDMRENAKYLPKEPPGGNSVKHKSFLTFYGTRKKSDLVEKDFGYIVTLDTIKSKVISPRRKFMFEFTHTSGYDSILTAINFYRERKLMGKKAGGYYYFIDDDSKTWRVNELYKWFATDESVPRWKIIIRETLQSLYPDDNQELLLEAENRIIDYYFEGDKFNKEKFTSLNKSMLGENEPSISADKDIESIMDIVDGGKKGKKSA